MNRINERDQNAVVKVLSSFSNSDTFAGGALCLQTHVDSATAAQWCGGRKHSCNPCVFGLLGRSCFPGRILNKRTH